MENNKLSRKKMISLIIVVLVIIAIISRIVYVNSGIFPSAKVKIVSQSEGIQNDKNNIKVNSCKKYTKQQWIAYLNTNNIESEQSFLEKHKNYAFASKLGNDEEYYILLLDVDIENTTQETQGFNMATGITLTDGVYSNVFTRHIYYTCVLNGKTDGNMAAVEIEPHQTINAKSVYITKDNPQKCAIENYTMGNCQKMNIKIQGA